MKKVKLEEILDVKRGASLSGKFYSTKGDKVRLTLGNFDYPNGGFKKNTSKEDIYFTGPVKKEYILKKGDIITPLTEQVAGLLGETARIPENDLYIQSGDIALIIPREKVLDKKFAYYLISSPIIKKQLGAAAQQTKIRHTSPDKIKNCETWIPELTEQRKIASFLDAINNKIENNIKVNQELEKLNQIIYNYWFIQFDYPNEYGKPYKKSKGKMKWNETLKKNIPINWKVQNLGKNELTKIIRPGIQEFKNEKTYIATRDVDKNKIISGNKITFDNRESRANMQPCANTVWFAKMKNSIKHIMVGEYSQKLIEEYIFSTGFLGLSCNTNISFEYVSCFINSNFFEIYKNKLAHGATQEEVNNDDIQIIPFIVPEEEVLKRFHDKTKDILKKIYLNNQEIKRLKDLREFLIPLLMNGQVKFK